jgi:hypothetical protein
MTTKIIRIDAIGQGNFQLRFVGDAQPSTTLKVAPGDSIRFVAYRNNRKIDYQIVFKSQLRSPFTDIDRIDMPNGGVTEELAVTTLLAGGMPFAIMIPSLGWHVDPEILVDGATMDSNLKHMLEQLEKLLAAKSLAIPRPATAYPITVTVSGNNFTFAPNTDPLVVHPGDYISWNLTQDGVSAPNFAINFSATTPPLSPLDNFENGISPDYWEGKVAVISNRIFRKLELSEGASKDFKYVIAMTTGNMPQSSPRTITLKN